MTPSAMRWCRGVAELAAAGAGALTSAISLGPPEQARRLHEEHEGHDDEDHHAGRLRVEELREALHQPEAEPGDDRAQDRAHAADDDHGEYDDEEVRAHEGAHPVDRRGE